MYDVVLFIKVAITYPAAVGRRVRYHNYVHIHNIHWGLEGEGVKLQ